MNKQDASNISWTAPGPKPWSTNQDRNLNPYQRHLLVKEWKEWAGWWFKIAGGRELGPSIVHLTIGFTQSRRRDPHNYCGTVLKAVIDGLVEVGAWPDDTPEFVGHREPVLVKGESGVRIVSRET